ncbi:unnamed protein product [Calypogeia fissa]
MGKFEVLVVLLQLPLMVLLLHWHAGSATATAAAGSVVTSTGRRSLDSPQLIAGGDVEVRARVRVAPASAPSRKLIHSGDSKTDGSQFDNLAPSPYLPPPPPPPQEPALCKYEVRTQTGTQWTAGTDSTISVRFYNKTQDNIYMVLTHGGLAAGHLDQFTNQGRCITDICKMELYTDATGTFPCWYVERVAVSISTPTVTYENYWAVNEWLPAHEWSPAGSLVRDDC